MDARTLVKRMPDAVTVEMSPLLRACADKFPTRLLAFYTYTAEYLRTYTHRDP
jgi:hypothetical protein